MSYHSYSDDPDQETTHKNENVSKRMKDGENFTYGYVRECM